MTRRRRAARRVDHLWFVLPGLLLFAAFLVYPMLVAFRLSVYDWKGLGNAGHFVGLANFRAALDSLTFYRALGHNLILFVAILLVQHTFGLFLAMQLNARPRFMEVYRAILFLPVILSLVATGFIWTLMLSPNIGIVDPLLQAVGLDDWQRAWLSDTTWALPCVAMVQAWNLLGWSIVIYMSGLQNVPQELVEAALLDGAGAWQRFRNVVFPLLSPSFTALTVITFVQNIRIFDVVYVLTGPVGAPAGRTDVLGTLVYRTAFGASGLTSADTNLSYAIAISVLIFLLMAVTATALLYGLRRREVAL